VRSEISLMLLSTFIRLDLNYEFGEVLMIHEDTYLLSIGHILQ
jgi:hypothetical protein